MLFRIEGYHTDWPELPLANSWNLHTSGHFAISLPHPEHELRGFSRKITEAFSTTPLASPSSTRRPGLTFRADLYTHLTGAISGTETVLGSANKVLQLPTSGCPWFLPSSQMAINPQEACCAFVVHSTNLCLHLFSTVHARQPTVNKTQQGP